MYDEISFLFGNLGTSNSDKSISTPDHDARFFFYDSAKNEAKINARKAYLNLPTQGGNDLLNVLNWANSDQSPNAAFIKPFMVAYLKELGVR